MSSNFWETEDGFQTLTSNSLDSHLSTTPKTAVRSLVAGHSDGLPMDAPAGTRVAFNGQLSALLCYPSPPPHGSSGTIVTVRTAMGDTTHHEGLVFVRWDAGGLSGIHSEHLVHLGSPGKVANSPYRRVVSSLGDLDDFLRVASDGPDLVHKATKDLWSLSVSGGDYVIQRLFDETGKPLKV